MLIISVGLQKSGSALIFNILNDLIVFNKGSDVRMLKEQHKLESILQYHNCNVSDFSLTSLKPLLTLSLRNTFVIKTHSQPGGLIKYLLAFRAVKAVVIIRDPRDIVASAMDHGIKLRDEGRNDTFATCITIGDTVKEVKDWVATIARWFSLSKVLVIKYEDLLQSQPAIIRRVCGFLNLEVDDRFLDSLLRRYDALDPDAQVRNFLHYNKAVVNRYLEIFSTEEVNYLNKELQTELELLGYD